jgi:cyclopropane fatty-acyl-phospholipid synthase-like methyltransferase
MWLVAAPGDGARIAWSFPMTATDPTRDTDPAIATAPTAQTVVACYSVYDYFFPALGFTDLTDGMYDGDPTRSYDAAQERQAEVLLDRAGVRAGSRVLDIGCGYGRILKTAEARRAKAWGITVSPEQVKRNTRAGLKARLQNYKHLGPEWDGQFDAVVANGSLEHFAQPEDAVAGRDDLVYRHLFATVHRVLDANTPGAKFVTTAIHFRERPDPRDWLKPPSAFAWGSPEFHWSRLTRSYGGWYPVRGQLEACANGLFRLVDEEDGTEDYRLTSEACLAAVRGRLRSWCALRVAGAALPAFVRRPVHTIRMLRCMLGSESWNWQFRGDSTPTILLRQTWERVE